MDDVDDIVQYRDWAYAFGTNLLAVTPGISPFLIYDETYTRVSPITMVLLEAMWQCLCFYADQIPLWSYTSDTALSLDILYYSPLSNYVLQTNTFIF